MLVIRLTRTGKISQESFRMVVAEKSKAVKRQYLELVGHYIPTVEPKVLKFDKERILYWISKGAQPTETVASLLKAEGVPGMEKYIHFTPDKKAKKKKAGDEEEKPAAPAAPAAEAKADAPQAEEAPAAPAAEAVTEEKKVEDPAPQEEKSEEPKAEEEKKPEDAPAEPAAAEEIKAEAEPEKKKE